VPALKEIGKVLKEERLKRGLSLEDVHKKTKISIETLKNIEESPEYLENQPYAKFLVKQLIKEYNLNVSIDEEKKEEVPERIERKEPKKEVVAFISALIGIFKFSFVISTIAGIFYLSQTTAVSNVKDRIIELISMSVEPEEPIEIISFKEVNKDGKKINDIVLKAKADIWLTAYVDGRETILKLKKGEKKKITFCKKIRFETIGNANKLEVVFDNKRVKLSHNKKILHNVFVDSEGIFINGYNIVE
jgi:transcriptional regulator with XRE-family HTH domain